MSCNFIIVLFFCWCIDLCQCSFTYQGNTYMFDESSVVFYRQDRTLAAIAYGSDNLTIQDCHIYDLDHHERTASLMVQRISQQNSAFLPQFVSYPQGPATTPIVVVSIPQMLAIIDQCRNLDLKRNPVMAAELLARSGRSLVTNSSTADYNEAMANISTGSVWRGIVPGTKWCGSGALASDYNDVGPNALVDSCCRSHDLCPTRIKPLRANYGLMNLSYYTKSYCGCDDEFYRCLKSAKSPLGDVLGNLYFNILRFGCMEDVVTSPEQLSLAGRSQPVSGMFRFVYNRDIRY